MSPRAPCVARNISGPSQWVGWSYSKRRVVFLFGALIVASLLVRRHWRSFSAVDSFVD